MAVTSSRSVTLIFTGDVKYSQEFAAAANIISPGDSRIIDLDSGVNTITVPDGGGSVPSAVTIVFPPSNTIPVTLKGIGADTGILLHLTDPATISLGSSVASFVLDADDALEGVRLIWS